MHERLFSQLLKADPNQTAINASCNFLPELNQIKIKFLNTDYIVDLDKKTIFFVENNASSPNYLQQLCILAYLIKARDIPLSGKLVTADKLDVDSLIISD